MARNTSFIHKRRRGLLELAAVFMLAVVMMLAALSLTGPAVGNVFSNIVLNSPSLEVSSSSPINQNSDRPEVLTTNPQPQDRMILRDATVRIVVEDTDMTISTIQQMTHNMGGWVVLANTSTTRTDDHSLTNGNITVRVPAQRLDEALDTIRTDALEVTSETVTGQDVTEEYVDLSARVRNLEATETQLMAIMDSAYAVADVLAVQAELTQTRSEIESLQGRLRFFDEAATYSSIQVTVNERVPTVGRVEVVGWNPVRTAENALGSLIVMGQVVVDGVIILSVIGVPVLLVVGLVRWVIRRVWVTLRGSAKEVGA